MSICKKPTLLLNMTYEPVGVVSAERAILLQVKDRVYIEEFREEYARTPNTIWAIPSVIRLKTYQNINENKRKSSTKKRKKIYIRDRYRCSYCDKKCKEQELTLDHVIPKSRGGADTHDNVVTSCISCNQLKGNRTPEEANMPLLHTPTKLKVGLDKHVMKYYAEMNPDWRTYLFLSTEGDKTHYGD